MAKKLATVMVWAVIFTGSIWSAATSAQNIANGQTTYNTYCVGCHGPAKNDLHGILEVGNTPSGLHFAWDSDPTNMPFDQAGTFPDPQTVIDLAAYIASVGAASSGPTFAASPTAKNFGSVVLDSASSNATITINNTGTSGIVSSVTSTNAAEFPLQGGSCLGTPVTVAQGGSCTVIVAFSPNATGGRSSTLSILTNGSPANLTVTLVGIGVSTSGTGTGTKAAVIEYFYAAWGYYFITANPGDIQALDSGAFPGWSRTGQTFNAYDASKPVPSSAVGVCRFFNDSFSPKSSHFYALHGFGCEQTIASFPDWQLESSADFYMIPPSATGTCPSGTVPVYRLYNNGQGGAPNHRFTTSTTIQAQMVAQGFGSEGVVMCGPQ